MNLSPLGFGHLPCCPQLDFIVELCRMALDENPHSFRDSPHSCLVWRSQLLIRFEFEPPRFRPLALLPPTRFYCGTMQNGTGWKSALILGIPRTVALSGEASYLFVLNWAPSVSAFCPVAPNYILLWNYAEWDWMKIRTNLGFPRTVA